MAVIHLIEHNLVFALCVFSDSPSEDMGHALRGDPGQAKIAGAFKDGMDRMIAFENDVLSILYLVDVVVAAQVNAFSFMTMARAPQAPEFRRKQRQDTSFSFLNSCMKLHEIRYPLY